MLIKKTGLVLGLTIPIAIIVYADFGGNSQTAYMAAIAVMMSIFWLSEAIPLAATALLPLGLFPVFGISNSKDVAAQYMNSTVFLLIGGFMIALAMQRWNLHKRIALTVLSRFGGSPSLLLLGFMLATAGLSMWISNTATTLMMLPIALAILNRYENLLSIEEAKKFAVGLLLSIAYSASIGGMMTLIGTAPNLVLAKYYENLMGSALGFAQWMMISVPVGISLLIALVVLMSGWYLRKLPAANELQQLVLTEKKQLGNMRFEETAVLIIFIITAVLWTTRKGLYMEDYSFQGWGEKITFGGMIDDGSVAIAMATLLFFIPARLANGEKTTILNEEVFLQLPWAVVVLFGGGFALAYGFSESGLSSFLAIQLEGLKTAGIPLILASVIGGMTLLTELTSNTATTQVVLPILQSAAEVMKVSPLLLMIPATLAASCAFMFPIATPPNAIVFGSGKLHMMEMVSLGVILNSVAILCISLMSYWLLPIVFEI